jgi:hypothetical protein
MKTITKFTPLYRGYLFPNRFEYKGLSRVMKFLKSNFIYGMCGGMVFSALDYYFDEKNIPKYDVVKNLPLNYTKYLWKRQTESTSFYILLKILYFGTLSKKKVVQKTIQNKLPDIINRLNLGLPAPIVIVRSSFFQNPTHNHQVLVTGYEDNPSKLELILYDPNHPRLEPRLVISNDHGFSITQSTGEPVRGFFLNHYTYKESPDPEKIV